MKKSNFDGYFNQEYGILQVKLELVDEGRAVMRRVYGLQQRRRDFGII